ncbi:MAG TPA: tripartite tricarboxylate transporter TctB family protein [Orrella sp.]
MKVNDGLIGLVLLLVSLATLWHVQDFPNIPGQTYGASLFPTVAAAGLAICSILLMISGLRSGHGLIYGSQVTPTRSLTALFITAAVLVGYALLVDYLGFYITASLALIVLMVTYGAKLKLAVPLGLTVTVVIHLAFYKLLGVPLPWGLLENYAW